MAVSIEAKIVNGLISHFDGIVLPEGVRASYPNVNFEPDGKPYVRLTVAKNTPRTHHIGGGKEPERIGLLLAVICWPVGEGIVKASELAGTIRDRFAFNTRIDHDGITLWVVEEPAVQGDEVDKVYAEIPVVIPWHCYP